MHEHDQELIMALAEGTLDGAVAATAAAEIAACGECSADLELQRFALEAIAAAPDVYLTATESAQLHSNLAQQLGVTAPAPVRPRRRFAWARWAPVAGVAAVFVLLVALGPGLMTAGDSDDASDEVVAGVATTAATDFAATEAPAAEMAPQERGDDAADGGASLSAIEDAAATTAAPETTAAPTETTTSADSEGLEHLVFLGSVEEVDTEALVELLAARDPETLALSDDAKSVDPFFLDCLLETASAETAAERGIVPESVPFILGTVTDAAGQELVLVAYAPDDVTETVFVLHVPFGCEVVETLP